jgi:hypothetical protein
VTHNKREKQVLVVNRQWMLIIVNLLMFGHKKRITFLSEFFKEKKIFFAFFKLCEGNFNGVIEMPLWSFNGMSVACAVLIAVEIRQIEVVST